MYACMFERNDANQNLQHKQTHSCVAVVDFFLNLCALFSFFFCLIVYVCC